MNSGKDFVDFLKDAKIKYFGFAKSQEEETTTAPAESTTMATVTVDVKWKESAVLYSYSSIEYYSEKTSVIKMADTGYYGLVDAKGNVVIQPAASQYFEHCSYGNGNIHYLLSPTDGGEGYEINMSTYKVATEIHGGHGANEDTIPAGYDDIDRYFNGLAAVKKNGKWGYIDKSKNIVIPIIFTALIIVTSILTWEGWYSAFVMAGLVVYSLAIALPSAQHIRYAMFIKSPLCLTYNAIVFSIGGIVYECSVLLSSLIGTIRHKRKHE